MDSIWGGSSVPEISHVLIAIYLAFAFFAARFLLDAFIYRRLAIRLLCKGIVPVKINKVKQAKIIKCSESMWKLTYYTAVQVCVLAITYHEPWFWDTKEYFRGWPNQELKQIALSPGRCSVLPLAQYSSMHFGYAHVNSVSAGIWRNFSGKTISQAFEFCNTGLTWTMNMPARMLDHYPWFSLKLFYMCQCGFYMYSIAALLMWETRRKDFSIMMSHHIITTILIGYSYITRFFRIGSIILALHDTSDVFMEAAKIFKYSGKELGASIFFGLFAISWLLLRLVFFPFWVIRSSSYDVQEFLNLSESYPISLYYVFNTMLLMLLVFHMYWWILICSMVLRQLKNRGKVGEDIRSDSEDDD